MISLEQLTEICNKLLEKQSEELVFYLEVGLRTAVITYRYGDSKVSLFHYNLDQIFGYSLSLSGINFEVSEQCVGEKASETYSPYRLLRDTFNKLCQKHEWSDVINTQASSIDDFINGM